MKPVFRLVLKLGALLLVIVLPTQALAHCGMLAPAGHTHGHHAGSTVSHPPAAGEAAEELSMATEQTSCTLDAVSYVTRLDARSLSEPPSTTIALLPCAPTVAAQAGGSISTSRTRESPLFFSPAAAAPLRI